MTLLMENLYEKKRTIFIRTKSPSSANGCMFSQIESSNKQNTKLNIPSSQHSLYIYRQKLINYAKPIAISKNINMFTRYTVAIQICNITLPR